jgi:Holliday junction resolvase RusA-like endonuclease
MATVSFIIPQLPKGKARHSTVVTLRCDRCQRTVKGQRSECPYCQNKKLCFLFSNEYTPAEQREYENFASLCAAQAMNGKEKFTGATRVECRFFFPIPQSRVKKLKDGEWHTQRPDTDNCVKSAWDAMNKICFTDDCVVVQMAAEKKWTAGMPRTEVFISSLEAGDGQPVGD